MESLGCSNCNTPVVKKARKPTVSSKIDLMSQTLSNLTNVIQDLDSQIKTLIVPNTMSNGAVQSNSVVVPPSSAVVPPSNVVQSSNPPSVDVVMASS